jgi:hypothetical protein
MSGNIIQALKTFELDQHHEKIYIHRKAMHVSADALASIYEGHAP